MHSRLDAIAMVRRSISAWGRGAKVKAVDGAEAEAREELFLSFSLVQRRKWRQAGRFPVDILPATRPEPLPTGSTKAATRLSDDCLHGIEWRP